MHEVYLALGSNLGDRVSNLERALLAVTALDETNVLEVSHVVESEPWGVADQPPFANLVARVETGIDTPRLLGLLKEIEVALGRVGGERNGPRVIDIDILLVGDEEWNTPDLVVPHPRMAERDFVVTPLLEIASDVCWPDGTPIGRDAVTVGRVTGSLGPVPGFEDVTPVAREAHAAGAGSAPEVAPGDGEPAWTEVSVQRFGAHEGGVFVAQLLYDAALLEQEGFAIAWDPMPPNEEYSPWSLPRTYRLLVPSSQAERARRVLLEAHAGEIVPEDETVAPDEET